MIVIDSIQAMQKWSMEQKKAGFKVGIVPTMGFLHAGHLSLIDAVRNAGADKIVVTIFVNPIQFAPNEDFDKYPRDFEHDKTLCEEKNVDVVFAPTRQAMYPAGSVTCMVVENTLSQGLCAKTRPTHFAGVTTVVAKLFNAVLPDVAAFGQKDAQQARVLKRMVRDLNFPIEMVIAPIVRERDGLALSSRNQYLSQEERSNALVLSRSLRAAAEKAKSTEKDFRRLTAEIVSEIEAHSGKVDYVECLDAETLENVNAPNGRECMICCAAYFGKTRLIDNILFSV